MKTILSILAMLALVCTAPAQFIQGPSTFKAFTNPTSGSLVFALPSLGNGSGVTNVSTSCAKAFPIGANGFGITINQGSTNTLATTNGTSFVFEFSGDGINWATNNRLTFTTIPLGNTYAPTYTNIANTVPNVGNATLGRIRQIVNTNQEVIWITNMTITTR